MIEYKSTRDLETFSKFLDSGGELPEEELVPVGAYMTSRGWQGAGKVNPTDLYL